MRTVFYEKMRRDVETELFDDKNKGEVILKTIVKRNDVSLTGLMIVTEKHPVSPVIYLDDYYDMYREGRSYTDVLNQVVGIARKNEVPVLEPEQLIELEQIKDNVFLQVIDLKQNRRWLEDKVYHVKDDLACTYRVYIESHGLEATIPICKEYLDVWNVSTDELRAIAEENLRGEKWHLLSMNDVIRTFLEDPELEKEYGLADEMVLPEPEEMYVLKLDRQQFGASVLLREDAMKQVGERLRGDYYIIPSSQHELIVLPVKTAPSLINLQNMVKEINETEVDPQDRLNNDLLYYDREGERLMKVADYYAEKLGISKEEMESALPEKKRYRDEMER